MKVSKLVNVDRQGLRPCCSGIKIFLNNTLTFGAKSFSNNFEIADIIEIGQ